MIRILVWGLLAYIAYRIVVSILKSGKKTPGPSTSTSDQTASATYRDPVCGVYISEDDAIIGRLEGERHYFCSHDCLEKFREKLEQK